MAEVLLKIENLRAGYGAAVVLDGVSLELAKGESLALLGRNPYVQSGGAERSTGAQQQLIVLDDQGVFPQDFRCRLRGFDALTGLEA